MTRSLLAPLTAALLAATVAGAAGAQGLDPIQVGRQEFESNCATCHGIDARGDGPMRPFLARVPTDLTRLAERNGGTFPRASVADLIDGRGITEPGSHGSREMPVWGRVFREQSVEQTRGTPFPPEWGVRGRIYALVAYLQSVQRP